jgi:peptide/nickel transport system substrate-binding protein
MVINQVGPNAALKKLEVRQALNYAVNKRNIVQVAGGSKVASATGQIFSESVVGQGFEKQDPYSTPESAGDPAKAKQLLAQAGYPNGLPLTLAFRSSGNNPKYAETLVQDMAASGFTVTPKQVPARDFYNQFLQKNEIATAGEWDIALPGWSPDWEGSAARSFFTPLLDGRTYGPGSTNYGGYNSDAVNTAADKALSTTDQAESAKQWNEVDKMIMADSPWVPIFNQTQATYVASRVKNFQYAFGPSNTDMTQVGVQ